MGSDCWNDMFAGKSVKDRDCWQISYTKRPAKTNLEELFFISFIYTPIDLSS